jgi:hypothetical protein
MKLLFILLLTVSCATPYQKHGYSGGYWEKKVGQDLWEVGFSGNGYTSSLTVSRYLKKRCAELTLKNGFTHYIILDKDKSQDSYLSKYNNTYDVVTKDSGTALIKMISRPSPDVIAFDASLVIQD